MTKLVCLQKWSASVADVVVTWAKRRAKLQRSLQARPPADKGNWLRSLKNGRSLLKRLMGAAPKRRAEREREMMMQNRTLLLGIGIGLFVVLTVLTTRYVFAVLAG